VYGLAEDAAAETLFAASSEGLFASRNEGASWTRRPELPSVPVLAVAAAVGPEGTVLAGTHVGLWRIPAMPATAAAPADSARSVALPGVQALARRGGAGSSVVLASARGQPCVTEDAGRVWRCEGGLSTAYAAAVSVDPSDPDTAYAGTMGSGAFSSRDLGRTWSPVGNALQNTAVRAVVRDAGTRRLYAATDGGVFVSADGGPWTPLATLPRTIAYALALDPDDGRRLWAGTAEGLFESVDAGVSWTRRPLGTEAFVVTSLLAGRGRLHAGTLGAGVVTLSTAPAEAHPADSRPPIP
jgi:ligand-binding sensor domain-containing protein